MKLAALFLFFFSTSLTFAPIVRYQNLQASLNWHNWIGFISWLVLFSYIHRQTVQLLPNRDPYLIPLSSFLSGLGLMTIWRLSPSFGLRQNIWFVICMVVLIVLFRIPNILGYLRRYKYIWLSLGLALTLLTFFLGTYPGGDGPHLWLGFGGVYLQPSEPLKLLLIIFLAALLADRITLGFNLVQLILPTIILTGLVLAMLVFQRDMGTIAIFIIIYTSILFIATGRRRIILISGILFVFIFIIGYQLLDVVRIRIDAWLNPWLDPSNHSYQIVQSLITVASGGLLGKGPGLGNPSLVPVAQSDFIFSAISEEIGLLGTVGLVLVIGLLVVRGLKVAIRSSDLYRRYLATGLSVYICAQSLLIIGGNLNFFPLTGITLPFVSYGGSSLLTSFISLGLLVQTSNQKELDSHRMPESRPHLQMGAIFLSGFAAIILINSWWSVWRSSDLVNRNDNPRQSIGDLYVKRGALLDRNGSILVSSTGTPGNYSVVTAYPPLSPILGYTDPIYGQSGLEASLNSYLRGLQGYPEITVFWNQIIYGQHPQGLDVRLTLSLSLQKKADALLGNNTGAIVVLNANTGETLVMASHPYFDANTLNQNWSQLINDSQTPLLNRTLQGLYPPGTALGPFFLADEYANNLPSTPSLNDYSFNYGVKNLQCAFPIQDNVSWNNLISYGCPQAILRLTATMDSQQIGSLYKKLGFFSKPNISLPAADNTQIETISDINLYALGEQNIAVSPFQMALAAASLTNQGIMPAPVLAASVNLPSLGWTMIDQAQTPSKVFSASQAMSAINTLASLDFPGWESVGTANSNDSNVITWFIGGTLPNWQGAPIAIAVLLEQNNPQLAKQIGQSLILASQNP